MPPKKRTKPDSSDYAPAAAAPAGVLDGTVILLVGDLSKPAVELKKLIANHGGDTLTRFTAKVTHLVTVAGNPKIEEAAKKNIHCVSEDWLHESIAKNAKQDEKKFELAAAAGGKRAAADDESETKGKRAKKAKDDAPAAAAPAAAPAPAPAPAPAAAAPKEEEKKVKVIKKGKAPVDPTSGMVASHYVHADSDGTVWDCMLNQTNIGQNNNKFYVIQILVPDGGGNNYCCFQRWGRVGEPGQNMKRSFPTLDGAKGEFMKKFKDKSGNDWNNRHKFQPKPQKYTLIEIDYGNDDPAPTAAAAPASPHEPKKEQPGSQLDKRVQDVVSMIFDIKMMENTLVELEFDVKKMPLGKLTKAQVKAGYTVLKEIEEILQGKEKGDLIGLSSRFYTLIPHNFGRSVPPPIKSLETLKQKMNLLEAMADVELAQSILKETAKDDKHNAIDANYAKLKCKIMPVDKNSDEYKEIASFVAGNQEKGRQQLELLDLFVLDREGEHSRFETKKHVGNRKLLWHGSRLTNFAGILSQGLRIAPPEAPASGYRFGKGLYFADIMTLSSMYCRATAQSPVGFMLLCDTALGKPYEAPRDQYMDKPPAGFDSTWALGTVEPDPKGDVKHPSGYAIPAGKIGESKWKQSEVRCHEHQYITYNEAQSEMKYLLKLKWVKF